MTGATDEVVAIHKQLTDLIGYDLPAERVRSATFPLPSPEDLSNAASAHLLWQAARLTLREGAMPFRSLGRISIRPRAYQFVPLLMALRLDPVRLLIADDVGVGKTIEALLIARELYDRGEIRRLCVLCPPYLCEQWQKELSEKFNLEAVVIRSGTINQLECRKAGTECLGETHHEHRRQAMLARQLGLTKTYNLSHNPTCADADIARLCELHAAMDRAILACYGWTDFDPGHGFHQNERGQMRFTISPTARREVLRRLLALNLDIAAREAIIGSSS